MKPHGLGKDLTARVRKILRDKNHTSSPAIAHDLSIEPTQKNLTILSRIIGRAPGWVRINRHIATYRNTDPPKPSSQGENDTAPIPFAILSVRFTDYQLDFLRDQKAKSGQSIAAQVRELIDRAMNPPAFNQFQPMNGRAAIPARPRTFMKSPQASNIHALNKELKAIFALKSKTPAYIG